MEGSVPDQLSSQRARDVDCIVQNTERLDVLRQTALLDTPAEVVFDRLTRLAVKTLAAPVALISLVDEDRQFFKSCIGLPEPWNTRRQAPLSHCFCQHVVATCQPLIISDVRNEPFVCNNPAISELGVVAYAGTPLLTAKGCALGSFCVIDTKPRAWTKHELEILKDLAASAVTMIELRLEIAEHRQTVAALAREWREHREVATCLSTEQVKGVGNELGQFMQRKHAEMALTEQQRFIQYVADLTPVVLYVYEIDNKQVRWVNREVGELLGYQPEHLHRMGKKMLSQLMHPDDFQRFREYVARLNSLPVGKVVEFEYRMRHANGRWRWMSSRDMVFTRFADGRVESIVGAAMDITARKANEERLQRSEEQFRLATQAANCGIWDWNILTGELQWSGEVEKLAGLAPGQFTGTIESFSQILHPDDRARVWEELEQLMAVREQNYTGEYRFIRPNGEIRWMSGRGQFSYDAVGVPLRMVGVVQDITLRKTAEEALKQADRQKDEFLAMLAHELRNPLTSMSNAVQLLELLKFVDERQRWALDVVKRQVEHIARLVDDLLDVSRIARGKITLYRKPVELQAILNRAVEACRPLIDERRQQLTITLPTDSVHLQGDAIRLVQVFTNLLNNAAKYTNPKGRIWLTTVQQGSEVVVKVQDSGIGISSAMLPHVFDLFAQSEISLERAQGGLGIGLTLVRRLVEIHGGSIEVFSAGTNQGSEFVVQLPILTSE